MLLGLETISNLRPLKCWPNPLSMNHESAVNGLLAVSYRVTHTQVCHGEKVESHQLQPLNERSLRATQKKDGIGHLLRAPFLPRGAM